MDMFFLHLKLLMEMQRLCDNNITLKDSQDAWQEIYPMLLQQAKLDAQQSVQLKKLLDYIPDSQFIICKKLC